MVFTCPVCESSDYDVLDGLYFCKICSTQSQEIHVQEAAEVFVEGQYVPLKQIKTKTFQSRKVASRDLGRPWTIYEGYQCILLAQCDALIALGAKEDLKDVVFLLWANYLRRLRVAFCKAELLVPKIVTMTGHGREREIHRGTMEEPWNRKRKRGSDSSDSDSEDSLPFMAEAFNNRNAHHTAIMSVEWMDLKKTAAFCFIGLRVTNPEILRCQFVQWIYEGKVPFMSTTHLLKPDMILYGQDYYLFQPIAITVQKLLLEENKLTKYLTIIIPAPSMEFMIDRLVDSLCLPSELKGICERLHAKVKYYKLGERCYDKNMDFASVKYLGLSLKMIFGLDDYTECQLSDYAQQVQKLIGSEGNVFVWSEWRRYQIDKMKNEFDAYREFQQSSNYNHQHMDQLLTSHHNYHKEGKHKCLHRNRKGTSHKLVSVEALKKPLEMALAGCDKNTEACQIPAVDETSRTRFTESTLSHIVEVKAFQDKFKDTMDKSSWKSLKYRRKNLCKNLVYKSYSTDNEEKLRETRPNSYLWLLEVLAKVVDCHIVTLDIALTHLQNCLEEKMIKDR